jgi:hypothetical protein
MEGTMKKLILFFALITCSSAFGLAEIEKKYDRFTKQTEICTKVRLPNIGASLLTLEAYYDGEFFTGNIKTLLFTFVSRSSDWRYINCSETHFLIDGEPYNPGNAIRRGTVGSGHVMEFLLYPGVKFSDIEKMADATKIEVKICNTEFVLSQSEMDDLKQFVRLLTPAKGRPLL